MAPASTARTSEARAGRCKRRHAPPRRSISARRASVCSARWSSSSAAASSTDGEGQGRRRRRCGRPGRVREVAAWSNTHARWRRRWSRAARRGLHRQASGAAVRWSGTRRFARRRPPQHDTNGKRSHDGSRGDHTCQDLEHHVHVTDRTARPADVGRGDSGGSVCQRGRPAASPNLLPIAGSLGPMRPSSWWFAFGDCHARTHVGTHGCSTSTSPASAWVAWRNPDVGVPQVPQARKTGRLPHSGVPGVPERGGGAQWDGTCRSTPEGRQAGLVVRAVVRDYRGQLPEQRDGHGPVADSAGSSGSSGAYWYPAPPAPSGPSTSSPGCRRCGRPQRARGASARSCGGRRRSRSQRADVDGHTLPSVWRA